MLKQLRSPEVAKEIIDMKLNGATNDDIKKMLLEKFGIDCKTPTITNLFENEIRKLGIAEFESKDFAYDKEEMLKKLVDVKAQKIELILNKLENMIQTIDSYRQNVITWVNALEIDVKDYYEQKKLEGKITISQANLIKDSILKSVDMLTAGTQELMKFLEIHTKMLELTRPAEVKVNNIDMSIRINQEMANIEKLGYLMVKIEDPAIKDELKKFQKEKKLIFLSQLKD